MKTAGNKLLYVFSYMGHLHKVRQHQPTRVLPYNHPDTLLRVRGLSYTIERASWHSNAHDIGRTPRPHRPSARLRTEPNSALFYAAILPHHSPGIRSAQGASRRTPSVLRSSLIKRFQWLVKVGRTFSTLPTA